MTHIRIVDRPCGYGKSTEIINSYRAPEKYITVVPFLSEIDRFMQAALDRRGFRMTQPEASEGRKTDHCEKIIRAGKSVICTSALFYRLGSLATKGSNTPHLVAWDGTGTPTLTERNLLDDYNLIIDEVITPFEHATSVKPTEFAQDYVDLGMARVEADGRVVPTGKWDATYEAGNGTFDRALYERAKSGALYQVSDNLFVLTVPFELLTRPKTVTIYTYLSQGSVLLHFLNKHLAQHPGLFTLEVDRLPADVEARWRQDVSQALTVEGLPELEKWRWTYSAQLKGLKTRAQCVPAGNALRKFRGRALRRVDLTTVMLTSARSIWCDHKTGDKPVAGKLSVHTRMFGRPTQESRFAMDVQDHVKDWSTTGVQFVPNTTRGTNKHSDCTTAIYLYDQHPQPQLLRFLGLAQGSPEAREFADAYALTELVQWLFRSCIRKGGVNGTGQPWQPRQKATVYLPSQRMRNLLTNWLETGEMSSHDKDGIPHKPQRRRKRVLKGTVPA
ncbi:MAG: hypothetical protein JXQ91_03795 [Vannielia sp.]|uniref:hypothetical protein n=1 Tax=Vannielia sp. TaxID=2813045 RepID=UPI003B8DF42E